VGTEPTGVAANPVTNKVYVALDDQLGEVAVIDGKTQQVTTRIVVGRFALTVAVNPLTNRIYASGCNSQACNIAVIDGSTDTLMTLIPVNSGSFIGIQGMAVNPVTNRVYASDADNLQFIVIDGRTNTIIDQVPLSFQPSGVAVNPKTNHIFIGNGGFPGEIAVYDGQTDSQLASIPENSSISNIATNFRLDRAYGTVQSDSLAVVDGATNSQIANIPTGSFPNGVDVNLQNGKVYVANSSSQTVTIIDGKTDQVLQTLPIPAVFPTGVAVNLGNGLTYISDTDSDQVIVLQQN
jgi:YVTN family beta-propeller protein